MVKGSIQCRELTVQQVRRVAVIPSHFTTDRVFRLEREAGTDGVVWRLQEQELPVLFAKEYDSGEPDQWLPTYTSSVPLLDLHFVGVERDGRIDGLLTWCAQNWNNSVWLVDIRVRQEAQRAGLGTALINHLKEITFRRGARGILVETQINNFPAVSLYRRCGFQIAGFNDHLYANRDLSDQNVALFLFWESG